VKKEHHPADMFYVTVSGARYISETPPRAWQRWGPQENAFNYLAFLFAALVLMPAARLAGQEAQSGFDVRATVSGEAIYAPELTESPRNGSPLDGAFRTVVYPTVKFSEHWTVASAVQLNSVPYFTSDFTTPGHAVTTKVLRANIGYSRFWKSGSVNVRAGQLSSAVGAFNLRYDDAVNPLIDIPVLYGYYGLISTAGLAGIQTDVTLGKWDARAQFVNSSLMDPRSIFDRDQYGNWAGGAGYTVRQGLRVGIAGARGPYLNRQWPFYFPGEANPNRLPSSSLGTDVQFARGHWNVEAEWNWMLMPYHEIPPTRREGAYVEAKRVLSPRWFVAVRDGYLITSGIQRNHEEVYEIAAGYRASRYELIKWGYEIQGNSTPGQINSFLMVQFVTTVHPISLAWH
jgi:hypothetical protein